MPGLGPDMLKNTKGFTLVELVLTIVIVSVVSWIIAEIIKSPMMTWRFNRDNTEILYLADLSMQRISASLKSASTKTLKVLDKTNLSFETNTHQKLSYYCQDNLLLEKIESTEALISTINTCHFEVKKMPAYTQVNVLLTFSKNMQIETPFYLEVYLDER